MEEKVIVTNRKARHEYEILENVEAGLVLLGSEVKSLRAGRANLGDAYAVVRQREVWVIGMHISPYEKNTIQTTRPPAGTEIVIKAK